MGNSAYIRNVCFQLVILYGNVGVIGLMCAF